MSLWISYRNVSPELDGCGIVNCGLEEFQYVKGGALINF